MAIADTITSMQNHTSNAYTMIGYGTDLTGINKNLENLSSTIFNAFLEALRTPDTLFTNLPKKSGTGANIILTGVANAPMRITLQPSELTQDATPTPSSPQEVHTISGDNTIKVEGKNILNLNRTETLYTQNIILEEDKWYRNLAYDGGAGASNTQTILNGGTLKVSSRYGQGTGFPCKCNANESYVLTLSNPNELGRVCFVYFDENYNYLSNSGNYHTENLTATTPNNCKWLVVLFDVTGNTLTEVSFSNIMLELGNQATTYEPYKGTDYSVDLGVKNLFDIKTNNLYRGVVISNGFFAATTAVCCQKFIEVEPGETYTVSFDTTATANINRVNFSFFVSNAFNRDSETGWITPFTATIPSNCHYILLSFKNNNTGTVDISDISNIQIEKGNVAHSYSEYGVEPINYSKIGNYEDKFIRTSGKNLFNENKAKDNFFYNSSGTTTTDNTNKFINMEIPLKSSYTISWGNKINGGGIIAYARICEYNGNTFIKRTSIQDNNTTLTLDSNTTKVIVSVDAGPNAYFVDLMINEGTTPLPYEPYGNGTWYIKKNIGKVVLDGSENWIYNSNSSYPFRLAFGNAYFTNTSNVAPKVFCDYYEPFAWNIGTKPDYGTTATVDNTSQITFRNIDITSKNDWLTWLGTHNTTLYYPLATPTYTQITGTLETQLENVYQKLLSYSGTTNISQVNNDLPFIMSVLAIEV